MQIVNVCYYVKMDEVFRSYMLNDHIVPTFQNVCISNTISTIMPQTPKQTHQNENRSLCWSMMVFFAHNEKSKEEDRHAIKKYIYKKP